MDDLRRLVVQMMDEYKKETDKQFDKHEKRMDKQDIRADKTDDRIDKMNEIQIAHTQKIEGILETLKDIKGDTVWLRRSVTGTVIGGTISAVIGFIVFAIQKLN